MKTAAKLIGFPLAMMIIFTYCCMVFAASVVLLENPFYNVYRVLLALSGNVAGRRDDD